MNSPPLNPRRLLVLAVHLDLVLIAVANYLAFWLRFDGAIPDWAIVVYAQMLPVLMVIRTIVFIPFRLHEGLWRYTGIWDLQNIVSAVLVSTGCFYAVVRWALGVAGYPRSIYFLDSILLIMLLGGIRLLPRLYREFRHSRQGKRILVYGAGDTGEAIVHSMMSNPAGGYRPVGFLDDDPEKTGRRIHGVPVLGTRQQLSGIMAKTTPHAVLLAMCGAGPATMRQVVKVLEPYKVAIQTLPNVGRLLDGEVEVSQIRNLSMDDLLERAPVGLDPAPLRGLISGKRVMVSGAGGSIGSEVCRQIAALSPKMLILYERYENSLHAINNELSDRGYSASLYPMIGDVTDGVRLETALRGFRPDIIFHAAAYKHVPLMELCPCEAVKNNVLGTRMIAAAADRHRVGRFILISTDKAVNPSSNMGATKRIAELIIQDMARRSTTNFMTVRFGNVLGSNGSVLPRFLEQIKAGGPVTVTHPDVRRYFMLIAEAVQLVLQAAALGEQGAAYVLEMGEQIRLVDLARNLIRLSGFVPDDEIAIKFIGLRPGEKLCEELVGPEETAEPSTVDKIYRVKSSHGPDPQDLARLLAKLEKAACQCDTTKVLDGISALVPAFRREHQDASMVGNPTGWPTTVAENRNRASNGSAHSPWVIARRVEGLEGA